MDDLYFYLNKEDVSPSINTKEVEIYYNYDTSTNKKNDSYFKI